MYKLEEIAASVGTSQRPFERQMKPSWQQTLWEAMGLQGISLEIVPSVNFKRISYLLCHMRSQSYRGMGEDDVRKKLTRCIT